MGAPTTTIHHVTKLRIGQQRVTTRGGFFREVYLFVGGQDDPVMELALFSDEPTRIEEEAQWIQIPSAA